MRGPLYQAFTDEEARIYQSARDLAKSHLRPANRELTHRALSQTPKSEPQFAGASFSAIAEQKLHAVMVPEAFGGLGKSCLLHGMVLESIAQAFPAVAVTIGVTNLVMGALVRFGSPAQKSHALKELASGKAIGAFSLSEPGAGSDASALQLTAVQEKKSFVVNGVKAWCSSAGVAHYYLVMARTSTDPTRGISAFLVPAGTAGLSIGSQEKKLGLWGSPLAQLIFDHCVLPREMLVGDLGEGFHIALSQLDIGRIGIAMVGTGIGWEALSWTVRALHQESLSREDKLARLEILTDAFTHISASRLLWQHAAAQRDRKGPISVLAAQSKLLSSEVAVSTVQACIDTIGWESVRHGHLLEGLWRDARALPIVEGTSQVQRRILARRLEKAGFSMASTLPEEIWTQ